jgi:hypothetical protein
MALRGHRPCRLVVALLAAGCAFALAVGTTAAAVATSAARAGRKLHFTTTVGSAEPRPGARTVPFFRDAFSMGGVTYPYTMVGSNPIPNGRACARRRRASAPW